jgi:hypothetical protein
MKTFSFQSVAYQLSTVKRQRGPWVFVYVFYFSVYRVCITVFARINFSPGKKLPNVPEIRPNYTVI